MATASDDVLFEMRARLAQEIRGVVSRIVLDGKRHLAAIEVAKSIKIYAIRAKVQGVWHGSPRLRITEHSPMMVRARREFTFSISRLVTKKSWRQVSG